FKECSMLQDEALPLWNYLYGARRGNPHLGSDAPPSKTRILEKALMKSRPSRRSKQADPSKRKIRQEVAEGCREMADVYFAVQKSRRPRAAVRAPLDAGCKARSFPSVRS